MHRAVKEQLSQVIISLNKNNLSQALFTVVLMFLFSTVFVDRFFTQTNLINVLRQGALVFSFSIAMALTMMLSGLDLSIGSVAAFSSVLAATLIRSGHEVLGIALALFVGLLLGLTSGIAVGIFGVPPFIMTFGMMKIANGLSMQYTYGESIYGFSQSFRWLGTGTIGIIPVPLILYGILLIVLGIMSNRSVYGRCVYAVGENRIAANFSGIRSKNIIMMGYAIAGLFSALAGIIFIARLGSADADLGSDWPRQAIAACVLGGVSFRGGYGSLVGTAMGALSVAILNNVLNLMGVGSAWQPFALGFIIVAVISLDYVKELYISKRRVTKNLRRIQQEKGTAGAVSGS